LREEMKVKILVIDDEESIRFTFESFLSKEGYGVLTAADFGSALKLINNNIFDLIFADIVLGGHTGLDILKEIKNRDQPCPVIMITGDPNLETAAEAVRLGAFDYLPKPIRKASIFRVTNQALKHKALLDEKDRIDAQREKYRRNLEAIFRSVQDAIVTVDGDMRIIEANEATERICGVSRRGIVFKKNEKIFTKCDLSCWKVLKKTLKTKKPVKEYWIECRHQHRAGQVVKVSGSPLMDQENKFTGAVLVIRDITRLNDLERELKERYQFQNIVGKSEKIQTIYRLVERLADIGATVLITGESGTGKELVARALHHTGIRSLKPLVVVNCSALSENLLESELFGHVKGAFTGAIKDREGRFQTANGGTIFLDEIGDISPRIQLKLLRVFEEKEFERVGDSVPIKADVRLMTATNRDLKEMVRRGEFREDLYYRLKVVEIALPPLRERPEDIPLLIKHMCKLFNKAYNKKISDVSDEVLKTFISYSWPGNARELKHALEHAFVLCPGNTITLDHLPVEIIDTDRIKQADFKESSVSGAHDLLQALNRTGWNKARAARLLGISRQTIYRKIEEYQISKPTENI